MIGRLALVLAGGGLALALTILCRGFIAGCASRLVSRRLPNAGREKPCSWPEAEGENENRLKLSDEQIAAAGIKLAAAEGGTMARLVTAPATIAADIDRLIQVTAKIAGKIAALRVKLGDQVAAARCWRTIESREIAEAKSNFLAAARAEELARITFERESTLWKKRVTAEQDFLKARAEAEDARIKLELARQKLAALGLGDAEIATLLKGRTELATLRLREVRAPIAGRVIEQQAALGAAVGPETKLFTVADLGTRVGRDGGAE